MDSRPKEGRTRVALLIVGLLIGGLLISPVGAHVGGSVSHLWSKHIKPKAVKTFYTKSQSNKRFGPRAYAVVDTTPAFMTGKRRKGFASVTRPATGVYCLVPSAGSGVNSTTAVVNVSVEWGASSGSDLAVFWQGFADGFGCAPGEIEVRTYDFAQTLTNRVAFSITVF